MSTIRTYHASLNAIVLSFMLTVSQIQGSERPELIHSYCLDCHQGGEAAAAVNLKSLVDGLSKPEHGVGDDELLVWERVLDQVESGKMPPEDAEQPTSDERDSMVRGLREWLIATEANRDRISLRRINRREYENVVRDLFDIHVPIKGLLPEDNTRDGFDTVGDSLELSTEAMLAYLQAADVVLDEAFGSQKAPTKIEHRTNLQDQTDHRGNVFLEPQYGKMFRKTPDGVVIFQSGFCPTNLRSFANLKAPAGLYRGIVKVRAIQSTKPVTMRIYGGDTITNRREKHLVGYFDIPTGPWTTITFEDRLVEDNGTYQIKCYGTQDIRKGADTFTGPGLEIGDITIEGPLDPWPPLGRQWILGDVDPKTASKDDVRSIMERVLPRALRRDVDPSEVDRYVQLIQDQWAESRDFESALKLGLKALLCSQEFLFLNLHRDPNSEQINAPKKNSIPLSEFDLASRLSFFLWSSMPDSELLELARTGQLRNTEVLKQQVERMLADLKSDRFVQSFTDQWLNLREIDFTEPDQELFPEYDELLRISMVDETRRTFRSMLDEDLALQHIYDSGFAFLNGRLAAHYGIDGVDGLEMRRVDLPASSPRGGLLTQASVLKVTANGTNTSAVIRGNWVLQNILGDSVLPPPSNVPAIEPDIRGATTLRQQLEAHRSQPNCASCHNKMDPLGFVLENFDPIGGWRTHYRSKGTGARPKLKQAPFTFAFIKYRIGLPVDTKTSSSDGKPLEDIHALKRWLRSRDADVQRCIARKLLTYGMGRTMRFPDRESIQAILDRVAAKQGGLRTLVHEIVQSEMFQGY